MNCLHCDSTKIEANGLCASCNHAFRKAERMRLKEPVPVKKVSEKHSKELNRYAVMRNKFLLGKWCGVHGKPCLPTDIHHQMGRVGFADDKEIPLLIDVRYWLPVCRAIHEEIEMKPLWAKEQGYSYSRITNQTI